MSSNFKSVPTTHPDPVRAGELYRLAIVGAGTLKGKEIARAAGWAIRTLLNDLKARGDLPLDQTVRAKKKLEV